MRISEKYVFLAQLRLTLDNASRVCAAAEKEENRRKNESIKEEGVGECPVCYENMCDMGRVVPRCGHEICIGCYDRLSKKLCVMCRVIYVV